MSALKQQKSGQTLVEYVILLILVGVFLYGIFKMIDDSGGTLLDDQVDEAEMLVILDYELNADTEESEAYTVEE